MCIIIQANQSFVLLEFHPDHQHCWIDQQTQLDSGVVPVFLLPQFPLFSAAVVGVCLSEDQHPSPFLPTTVHPKNKE